MKADLILKIVESRRDKAIILGYSGLSAQIFEIGFWIFFYDGLPNHPNRDILMKYGDFFSGRSNSKMMVSGQDKAAIPVKAYSYRKIVSIVLSSCSNFRIVLYWRNKTIFSCDGVSKSQNRRIATR